MSSPTDVKSEPAAEAPTEDVSDAVVLELLKHLALLYFSPASAESPAARQGLAYFLPVYAHSRLANMERLQKISLHVIRALMDMEEDLVGEEEDGLGVSLTNVAAMLVDWTDGRRVVGMDSIDAQGEKVDVGGHVHLDLATDILERINEKGCSKEERKILVSMLGKLWISSTGDKEKLERILEMVTDLIEEGKIVPARDLVKLKGAVDKALKAIEGKDKGARRRTTMIVEPPNVLPGDGDEEEQTVALDERFASLDVNEDKDGQELEEEDDDDDNDVASVAVKKDIDEDEEMDDATIEM